MNLTCLPLSITFIVCALAAAAVGQADITLEDLQPTDENAGMLGDPQVEALQEPEPGLHEKINCITRPTESYALFVPQAHAKYPERQLPLLIVHNPGGNVHKDVKRYQQWAEANDVLIVGIYRIRNGMPDHHKYPIQDHVLKSLAQTNVRFHPVLKFTIGMSGGSADGFRWVRRKPDIFAGAVMQGASTSLDNERYKHLILAYLHGAKDEWSVRGIYQKSEPAAERLGRPTKILIERDRKHEWAPQAQQEAVLTWMLHLAMLTHPKIDADQRQMYQQRIDARMTEAAKIDQPAERRAALETWLELPVADLPSFDAAMRAWVAAIEATLPDADQPIQRHVHLRQALAAPPAKHLADDVRQRWQAQADRLAQQDAVADDWRWRTRYDELVEQEKRAGLAVEQLQPVAAGFEQLATDAAGTDWADRAAADAAKLRRLIASNPKRIGD